MQENKLSESIEKSVNDFGGDFWGDIAKSIPETTSEEEIEKIKQRWEMYNQTRAAIKELKPKSKSKYGTRYTKPKNRRK